MENERGSNVVDRAKATLMVAGIVLGLITYGVLVVQVGYFIPILKTELALIGIVIVPVVLIIVGYKVLTSEKYTEIPQFGLYVRSFLGKTKVVHPLGIQEHKASASRGTKVTEEHEIPLLVNLLKDGLVGGMELLLGYHQDGTPRYGMWDDVRTFILAGKSRSGKTVTLVFFLLQALLAGGQVYVCDLHYKKPDGLLKILEPLLPFLTIARNEKEIIELTKQFSDVMYAREAGADSSIPCIYIVDEWTYTLRRVEESTRDLMVDTYLNCAEAYAAFNGYAIIAGHEWTARESGGKKGTALRRNTHSVFVHKLDEEYAKFLLQGAKGKKLAKVAPELKRGCAYLQDTEGEVDTLYIPYYGKQREAIYEVGVQLAQLAGVEAPAQLAPVNSAVNTKQDVNTPLNGLVAYVPDSEVPVYSDVNTLQAQNTEELTVNSSSVNSADIDTIIKRLVKKEVSHRVICYVVGLYGPKYDQYQERCKKLGIEIPKN